MILRRTRNVGSFGAWPFTKGSCCWRSRLATVQAPQQVQVSRNYSTSEPKNDKHVEDMRQWLHSTGALDIQRSSIQIRAERFLTTSSENISEDKNCDNTASSKIIHFQRHGQGYHNLLYRVLADAGNPVQDIYDPDPNVNPFVRPEIVDAPLTEFGRAQCAEQRPKASLLTPELLVVSPLHRAIQTAQITFADHHTTNKVPFVAHEDCREELGLLVCNKRRPLSETQQEFPNVDFSLITSGEQDSLWNPNERESPKDKSNRIYRFLVDYVRHLPQQEIAVVGHSAWLFAMCNVVMDCGEDEDLTSWFGTSEIRSMKVTFCRSARSIE